MDRSKGRYPVTGKQKGIAKTAGRLLTVLFTLGVFILQGALSILLPALTPAFYRQQFEENDTLTLVQRQARLLSDPAAADYIASLSEEELLSLMEHTMAYCLYREEDLNITIEGEHLEIFRPDEYSHMKDVRRVFGGGLLLILAGLLFTVAGAVGFFRHKKSYYQNCRKIPYITLAVLAALLLIVALAAAVNFRSAFNAFHRIFFAEDSWYFSDGVMIAMIGDIFPSLIPIIFSLWFFLFAGFLFCLAAINRRLKKRFFP